MNFLETIVRAKKSQKASLNPSPKKLQREYPLVPFLQSPTVICEIKKASPSKGTIAKDLDIANQARHYINSGVKTISVLTESQYFGGCVEDLKILKKRFPNTCFLRKDFLLEKVDIALSYESGADAVLLIAAILDEQKLIELHNYATELRLTALVEIHNEDDLSKIKALKPKFVGINSRDLTTFKTDLTTPAKLINLIDWRATTVFESGICNCEDLDFALCCGFDGALIGEAAVREPNLVASFVDITTRGAKNNFWQRVFACTRPIVKICGITNKEDAYFAVEQKADVLGFIFAPSPRRVQAKLLTELGDLDVLKVGVVVLSKDDKQLPPKVKELLLNGLLDAVQFHGDESPEKCYKIAFPYYKALSIQNKNDLKTIQNYHCPRVLLDAFSKDKKGGTGETISKNILKLVSKPLWLAGGLSESNIRQRVEEFNPELVDVSSRIELYPGKKDKKKLGEFLKAVK